MSFLGGWGAVESVLEMCSVKSEPMCMEVLLISDLVHITQHGRAVHTCV